MALIGPTLRFELRRLVQHPAFAAAVLLLAGAALALVATGFGPQAVRLTAPYFLAQSLGILTTVGIFVLTFFVAHAALGDTEHQMQELLFATPLTKGAWFAGRCAAVILAGFGTMAAAALVLLVAPLVMPVDPARVGPVSIAGALWALGILVLPNVVLVTAILFTAAALSGSSAVTAVAGIGVWGLFWVTALLVDSPLLAGTAPPSAEALARAALLDPFGLSAVFEQTRYWTPVERNERLVGVTGHLLLNRLLWLAVAVGMLVLAARRMVTRSRSRPRVAPVHGEVAAAIPVRTRQRLVPVGPWATWGRLTGFELRAVVRGWAFVALVLMWMMVVGVEIVSELTAGEYGTRLLPTTAVVVDRMLQPLGLMGTIVLLYFSGEIVWRDRVHAMHALTDATPAPALARLGSQLTVLLLLPVVLLVTGLAVGLAIQIAHGHVEWRPMVLLGTAWHAGLPLVLFGLGVFTLQVVVPNRWMAMMGGLVLAAAGAGILPGVHHPMLQYAAFPLAGYSDFDGFGTAPTSFRAFAAWWASVASVLLAIAWAMRHHGHDLGFRRRLRGAGAALGRTGRTFAVVAVGSAVVSGVSLASALARTTRFPDRAAALAWQASYEQAYRALYGRPQPAATGVSLQVMLEPTARRARVEGDLTLVHRGTEPIDTILLNLPRDAGGASLTVTRGMVSMDHRHQVALLVLPTSLQPGDSVRVHFAHALDRGGVHAEAPPRDITDNGTVLMQAQLVPTIGYRPQVEIVDPADRARAGLVTDPTPFPTADAVRDPDPSSAWVTMDVTIGTDPDQVALAVGHLVAEWDSAGRRWFRYRTPRPTTPAMAIVSARFARHEARADGTTVEVWHLPDHEVNVSRIADAALTAVGTLAPRLGALPDSVLRVVEVPRWSGFGAFALTGMILFPEHRGFMLDARGGDVDLILRRVAHEVAHQWWGHHVAPPQAEGALMLVESLAKDAEQVVVKAVHGDAAVNAILAYDEDRYLVGRGNAGADEPSLERLTSQSWLYYGKGSVMMHAVRAALGDARIDAALRAVVREHGGPAGQATVPHLRAAILAQASSAPDSAMVHEWFAGRAVWDVAVDRIAPVASGWLLTVRADRQADATLPRQANGATTPVVVEAHDVAGELRWRGVVQVRDGVGTLLVPTRAGVHALVLDPERRLIDQDRANNRREMPPR